MIKTSMRTRTLGPLLAAAICLMIAPALAQGPTEAQRDAVKSQCRNDYIAHCSSVPPGGEASLQCLAKNMSSLSPSCQSAVRAVEAAATPAKPAEATKPADAAKPTEAAKPKSSATAPATAAPSKSGPSKSAGPKPAAAAAAPPAGAAPAAGAPAAAAPSAAPSVIVLRPLRPREELLVLRSACGVDVRTICGGVAPGGGRIVQCLATNAAQLSPACKDVLSQFAAR